MDMKAKDELYEGLVSAYSRELYRFAYGLCGERAQSEDLVQETFLRAWRSIDQLQDPKAARAWLYTILRREYARLFQRQRPEARDPADLEFASCRGYDTSADAFVLRCALEKIGDDYREPLILQVLGGFSCGDIAEMMDLTPATAMTRVSRARRKLRELMDKDDSGRVPASGKAKDNQGMTL